MSRTDTSQHTYQQRSTADLMDEYAETAIVMPPLFQHFGAVTQFQGPLVCVHCFEDNSKVKSLLEGPGLCPETQQGQILFVNGQGSLRCALLGDMIARKAVDQGWAGVIIDGCIRDAAILAELQLGVMALAATPRKSVRRDQGEINPPMFYCRGEHIQAGHYCYVDRDGIVILPEAV